MIKATFYIKTLVDGRQYPVLNTFPRKFEMLYELGMNDLSVSTGVEIAVSNIEKVLSGDLEKFELSTGDWCVVDVGKEKSVITNNFDEFEPVQVATSHIHLLMQEWLDFLKIYESGGIPGISPPSRPDL